jgi:hypothetical protein
MTSEQENYKRGSEKIGERMKWRQKYSKEYSARNDDDERLFKNTSALIIIIIISTSS